ncbi:MAG: hypothetical protein WEC84_01065, partial [Candidatus Andersenbacteria bacterium]
MQDDKEDSVTKDVLFQKENFMRITPDMFEAVQVYCGETLCVLRWGSRFSVEEMARQLSKRWQKLVPVEWIQEYELGDCLLTKAEVVAIAHCLGVSISEVYKGAK